MIKITFYTNEGVNIAISDGLKRRGVNVFSARDANNLGLSDDEQLDYAKKNNLVIVTHDVDFLTMATKYKHKGIIYVHQQKYSIGDLIRKLELLYDIIDQKEMENRLEFL
ncbi:MAG: hypothetical protein FVQ77_05520 [Cytophagales bacterium]|nr:hypothetical protein [Cytophagales bacterium]